MNPEYISIRSVSINQDSPRQWQQIVVFSTKEGMNDVGSLQLFVDGWKFVPNFITASKWDASMLESIANRISQLDRKVGKNKSKDLWKSSLN